MYKTHSHIHTQNDILTHNMMANTHSNVILTMVVIHYTLWARNNGNVNRCPLLEIPNSRQRVNVELPQLRYNQKQINSYSHNSSNPFHSLLMAYAITFLPLTLQSVLYNFQSVFVVFFFFSLFRTLCHTLFASPLFSPLVCFFFFSKRPDYICHGI